MYLSLWCIKLIIHSFYSFAFEQKDHWIDYIQVVDASADSGRRLASHAKTLLYLKGWQSDGVHTANAGFDFDILKADKVTHIKAAEHCNLHGLWWSQKIAIADIPVCTANMASENDASRRELAGHAGKFAKVANGANPCPTSPANAPSPAANAAANAPSPAVKSDASTTSSVGNVLKAAATVVLGLFL
jgi:desulfoferrodoxin (superoxide reductase-like protein)